MKDFERSIAIVSVVTVFSGVLYIIWLVTALTSLGA